MGSAGDVKKLLWEKKKPVKRGQNPRFFLKKKSDRLEKPSQETRIC